MKADDYVYAVAYIKTLENKSLTKNDFYELSNSENAEKFIQILEQKGYKNINSQNFYEMLGEELKRVVKEVESVCEGEFLKFFLLKNDFHNLKTLIKAKITNMRVDNLMLEPSVVDLQKIRDCVFDNDFNSLPEELKEAAKQACRLSTNNSDPQQMEIYLDKSLCYVLYDIAKKIKNDFLIGWVRLNADIINMKIATRCIGRGLIDNALIGFSNLDFTNEYFQSTDEVVDFFEKSVYIGGGKALKKSVAEFEKWCDNLKIDYIKSAKNSYFGIEPVFSFLVSKEYELQALRLIFYGKKNELSPEEIKERLRDFYG